MVDEAGFIILSASETAAVLADRERNGWRVFRLPSSMSSKREFFEGVRRALPLDPPLQGQPNWDALEDSLWNGLDGLENDKIVIVWPDSSRMQSSAPEEFSIAQNILSDLPDSLANVELTGGSAKRLLIVRVV